MGDSPCKVRGVGKSTKQKVGRLWFGGRCSRISRGTPEARSRLCVCRASFLMTFAMGGAPAPGSDRIPVELFQIMKDDAEESAARNMQYAICTQYAICRLLAPVDVSNLISGSSAFSKTSLNIWKFMVHVLLKPGLKNFEYYFTSMRDEYSCVVV